VSGPCLSSSVAGRPLRPATRLSLGGPLPHQLADRPRAHRKVPGLAVPSFELAFTSGISSPFSELFQASRQIAHVLRTLAPLRLRNIATSKSAFDLHVLSTPPAFVLSQNQTLRIKTLVDSPSIVKSKGFNYLVKTFKFSQLTG
jgi:hypothetical protein